MSQVTFDPSAFVARYPKFAAVSTVRLGLFFDDATLYLSNSDDSPVQNLTRRASLLNMLTAHIGKLAGALSADGQTLPVGRLSQAAEGSVSASFEYATQTASSAAWYNQTQYGAQFWQATASLRAFRYISAFTVIR